MILSFLVTLATGSPPCPVVPLTTGRSWTYHAHVSWTVAGSTAVRDTTITWTTRILDVRTQDSVSVALVRDWPTALAWWEPGQSPDTTLIVCISARLFQIATIGGGTAALGDSLLSGRRRPSVDDLLLQLPLHTGDLYGREPSDRPDTYYAWYVESATPVSSQLARLGARRTDSVYTVAYRTLPDHQILDYLPGFGLTRYVYAHHGTVAAASALLVATIH